MKDRLMTDREYDRLERILKAIIEDSRRRERKDRERKPLWDELKRRNAEWKASEAARNKLGSSEPEE